MTQPSITDGATVDTMPPGSLRDPEARRAISARFDSVPT